ncbi:MAG TPA: DUF2567 domain-containing protein [Pseudonocardiaceae bacterium]|jgi:uncharacterized membrane protein YeaQ/YmgE (transglycosylase-associated protein family)|nr:DUF2567 domain-containing protein [Pseudonocardiaceae bacterium]
MQVQTVPAPGPAAPGAVVRADVRPALTVLGVVALLGVPLGLLWSWLAPPEFVARSPRALTPGGVLPFIGQSDHRFDDMATFLLFGLAAGVLTGAALWLYRRQRGPLIVLAGVLGSLIAAWLAMHLGLGVVAARYPDLASTGAPYPRPPVLESSWVIIAQPFGMAVSYCIGASWSREWSAAQF